MFLYLVVMYMYLNVKSIKVECGFGTKVCDQVKNYVHHGKNQLYQKVDDGSINF